MNIAGKISSAQFRDVVLASWRIGRMERDIRAADMVREIKRRLLAELQANAKADPQAVVRPAAGGDRETEGGFSTDGRLGADSGQKRNGGIEAGDGFAADRGIEADVGHRMEGGHAKDNGRDPAAGRRSR